MLFPATCFLFLSILPVVRLQDCRVLGDCDRGTPTWLPYQNGVPGPKGEPGPGCDHCDNSKAVDTEPKLYFASNTLPYDAGELFCKSFGKTLCKFDDICLPDNNGGRTLVSEVIPGDHWVPISDLWNEWVEIGDAYVDGCVRHIALKGEPWWGLKTDTLTYRGYIYCCPAPTAATPDMIYDYIGQGATYDSALADCKSKNMRLCKASEICQDSVPKYGQLSKDMWVPIQDSYNDWIQIGNARLCLVHNAKYGAPPWGVRTDGSTLAGVGYNYCCSEGGTR